MSDAGDGASFTNAGDGEEESAGEALDQGDAQYHSEAAPSQDFSNAGQEPEQSAGAALEEGDAQYGADAAPAADFSNAAFTPQSVFTGPLIPTPLQAGLRYNTEVGISVFFKVMIDTIDLGAWAKCSGLGMNLAYDSRHEAGMTFFEHHLPKHLEYSKITLERPLTSDCQAVMSWITAYHMLPVPTSAQITCIDQKGNTITTWEMIGVSPESWRGPTFDAAAGTAVLATEQLSFFHQGFL
ncbi:MAG: phage tail protein [Actinomycetota bacterium]|nr:phage tail protein [Actinomycetota bacterium]